MAFDDVPFPDRGVGQGPKLPWMEKTIPPKSVPGTGLWFDPTTDVTLRNPVELKESAKWLGAPLEGFIDKFRLQPDTIPNIGDYSASMLPPNDYPVDVSALTDLGIPLNVSDPRNFWEADAFQVRDKSFFEGITGQKPTQYAIDSMLGKGQLALAFPSVKNYWENLKDSAWDKLTDFSPALASGVETFSNLALPYYIKNNPEAFIDSIYGNPIVEAAKGLGINIPKPDDSTLAGRALLNKNLLPQWDELPKYGYQFTPPKINPAIYQQAYGQPYRSPGGTNNRRRINNLTYGRI